LDASKAALAQRMRASGEAATTINIEYRCDCSASAAIVGESEISVG
jgi:hypothetical protein